MQLTPDFLRLRVPESDALLARVQATGEIDTWDEEQRCIGAAIADNSLLDGELTGLEPEDFADPTHGELLVVMRLLRERRGSFDLDTLCDILHRHNRLRPSGGRRYLRKLLLRGEKSLGALAPSARLLKRVGKFRREEQQVAPVSRPAVAGASTPAHLGTNGAAGTSAPTAGREAGATSTATCLADIDAVPVEWLWHPYLALGTVALLSGEPGCGTTYLALAIAAAVTNGSTPLSDQLDEVAEAPADSGLAASGQSPIANGQLRSPTNNVKRETENGNAVLFLATDSPSRVIRPRFDRLGGDPARLHLVAKSVPAHRPAAGNRGRREPLPECQTLLESIETALLATGAKLVIIDTLQAFVGDSPGRLPLDELRRLAEEYNCCILLVRHVNRARSGRVRVRTMSGLDLVGATSTELLAGISPYDPERRLLAPVRSNVGPLGPALGYAISAEGDFQATGPSELAPDGLLAPALRPEQRSAFEEAVSFLQEALAEGAVRATELQKRAKQEHISPASLQRAKARLGVVSRKFEGHGLWYWNLPGNEGEWADPVLEDLAEGPAVRHFADRLDEVEATGFFVKFARLATIEQVEKVDVREWVCDSSRGDYPRLLRDQFNRAMFDAGKPPWQGEGPCGTPPHTLEDLENLGVTREDAVLLVDLKKHFDYPLDPGCENCLVGRYDEHRLLEIMRKLLGEEAADKSIPAD